MSNITLHPDIQTMIGTISYDQLFSNWLNHNKDFSSTEQLTLQENTYSRNEKDSHPKNIHRQISENSEISQVVPSAQNRRRGSKHSDNGGRKLVVASALLSMGTGNEWALDMTALEREQKKIPNFNLEDSIENS